MKTWVLWCSLLAATPLLASNSGVPSSGMKEAKKQLKWLQQERITLHSIAVGDSVDIRGRHMSDDFDQFAFTKEGEERIISLLKLADGKTGDAPTAFEEATKLLRRAGAQTVDINNYWKRKPGIVWRERWHLFAEANGLSTDPPDPELVETERKMLEQLANGDFYYPSTITGPYLSKQLNEAVRKASSELADTKGRELEFTPRTTPCGKSQGNGRSAARIARAASPEDYYPPGSKRLEEEGSIVLRARIAPTSCATHVAIVVHSGYPALDEAAIKVFEATTFEAGVDESGTPRAGELTFKVKFVLLN